MSFKADKSDGDYVTKAQQRGGILSQEEWEKLIASYLFCYEDFYSLPEMINYMKENHNVEKTTVTKVFRALLEGTNAEAYLRESQRRMKTRTTVSG